MIFLVLMLAPDRPAPAEPREDITAYRRAADQAIKEGKALVIFVRCSPRPIRGAVSVRLPAWYGDDNQCVIVAFHDPENLGVFVAEVELVPDASVELIEAMVKRGVRR